MAETQKLFTGGLSAYNHPLLQSTVRTIILYTHKSEVQVNPPEHSHELSTAALKLGAVWAGMFAGIGLEDIAQLLGICVQFVVLVYTGLQAYILIRDKLIKRKRENKIQADTAPTSL
jgi:hypothetical protein